MNTRALLFSIGAVLYTAEAVSIGHDKVQPFPQPEPVTISEKAAVQFKPSLRIESGCHPYPAVNAAGDTSAGLKATGSYGGECEGSSFGSQVYGRAGWYRDLWAIMYAWYFPKDKPHSFLGHRHAWMSVVVWINNPSIETPSVTGVSTWEDKEYLKFNNFFDLFMNGTHAMIKYYRDYPNGEFHGMSGTMDGGGEFQDLIMWEQLTDEARRALNETDFGKKAPVPFIDANFEANLEKAWPIE